MPKNIVWSGSPQYPFISASLKNWGSYYEMRFFATQIAGVSYQWKIDGDIQPFDGPFCSYVGSQCGGNPALISRDYFVEVSAINTCDTTTSCSIFRYSCNGLVPSIAVAGYCGDGGGEMEMVGEDDISILVSPSPADDNVIISVYKKYLREGNALFENMDYTVLPDIKRSYKLRIFTRSGMPVYSTELNGCSISISTSRFSNGIYFIELSDGNKIYSQRFMVNH